MPKRIIHIWASAGGDVDARASSTSQPAVGAIGRRAGTRWRRFEPSTRRRASAFVRAIDPFRPARASVPRVPSLVCVSLGTMRFGFLFFFRRVHVGRGFVPRGSRVLVARASVALLPAHPARARAAHARARSRSRSPRRASRSRAARGRPDAEPSVAVRVPNPGGFFCARRPASLARASARGDVAARVRARRPRRLPRRLRGPPPAGSARAVRGELRACGGARSARAVRRRR